MSRDSSAGAVHAEAAEDPHGRGFGRSVCSAVAMSALAMAGGWTLSPPYVFSGKPTGRILGGRKKDGEPFQDRSGKWYVSVKGTIRRYIPLPNVPGQVSLPASGGGDATSQTQKLN